MKWSLSWMRIWCENAHANPKIFNYPFASSTSILKIAITWCLTITTRQKKGSQVLKQTREGLQMLNSFKVIWGFTIHLIDNSKEIINIDWTKMTQDKWLNFVCSPNNSNSPHTAQKTTNHNSNQHFTTSQHQNRLTHPSCQHQIVKGECFSWSNAVPRTEE